MKKMSKKISILLVVLISTTNVFAQTKPDALKLYNEGRYKEAVEVCEAELIDAPHNLESYVVMCWALVANRQYSEAEQRAMEARKINSYDVRIMEVLGEAEYFLGKNNEALSMFQSYIANVAENGSRVGRSYYYMGEIYIRQARYEHADIALTTAVRTEPLLDYWWTRLGYAREMTKDYKNAIVAYDRALSLNAGQKDASAGKLRCQNKL